MRRLIVAVGLGATVAGTWLVRRHRLLARIAPDLRHRRLYLSTSLRGPRSLRTARRSTAQPTPVADGVDVRTDVVPALGDRPGVRILVYEAAGGATSRGALVWMHGGGLVMGTPEHGHQWSSRLAADAGVVVVSVDYRLAPEDPFPAGLEDCYSALAWTHDHAGDFGIDRARIAVGGESAGGGLAACVAQLALDRGGPPVCFQLLLYPMLDDRTARRRGLDAVVWSNTSNRYAWSAYLGHPVAETETREYASAARRVDLRGLPPAWIGVGDLDLFHEECVEYADRLRAAGVRCDLDVVPGMYHAAEHVFPEAPSMRALHDRMTAALRSAISTLIDTSTTP